MTAAAKRASDALRWEPIAKHWEFYKDALEDRVRVLVSFGGAGSGKSHTTMQWLLAQARENDDLNILILRKTSPSHRISTFLEMKKLALRAGQVTSINESRMEIVVGTSTLFFRGLDDPEKVKSANASIVWMEETTEFTWDDFMQLDTRLREAGTFNQIYCTFNPISQFHWCVKVLARGDQPPNKRVLHSTWKDNPHLPDDYVERLLAFKDYNKNYYDIYTLGKAGVLEHIIYRNWEIRDSPTPPRVPDAYGMDFGHNSPTVMVAIWVEDGFIVVRELLYKRGMTQTDVLGWFEDNEKTLNLQRHIPIYCDPGTSGIIEDLGPTRAGWNTQLANKAVEEGLNYCKGQHLVVSGACTNLIEELQNYQYYKDKDGNVLDRPVKVDDHAMDAMRYAIYTDRVLHRGPDPMADMYGGYGGVDVPTNFW